MGTTRGLEDDLGYSFDEPELLRRALIHASAKGVSAEEKNQAFRLSWLGDAILDLVVSDKLYTLFGNATKEQLHRWHTKLTSNAALGAVAVRMGLDNHVLKAPDIDKNPAAKDRHRMLASILEAVFGAVYADGGVRKSQSVIRRVMSPEFDALLEGAPRESRSESS